MMWVVSVWCVLMVVCVSPGCMSQAVTPELLEEIMPQIWNTYGKRITMGQFSLAISVPWNSGTYTYDLQAVFAADRPDSVISSVNSDKVYNGYYVIAAKADKGNQHSELRVLDNWDVMKKLKGRDLLIFYTLNSPCLTPCTDQKHSKHILGKITIMKQWDQYAVVFRDAFLPKNLKDEDYKGSRYEALKNLDGALGSNHIYRCLKNGKPCFSCGEMTGRCVTLDGEDDWIVVGGRKNQNNQKNQKNQNQKNQNQKNYKKIH